MASMCERWTERHRNYLAAEKEELQLIAEEERTRDVTAQKNEEFKKNAEQCRQEILSFQSNVYHTVAESSLHDNCGSLLLSSVAVPEASTVVHEDIASQSDKSSFEKIDMANAINLEQTKTRKAQHYRNLAEKLQKEKREMNSAMNEKIELVRDFWRNKIIEGSSRAGRIVQKALLSRYQRSS